MYPRISRAAYCAVPWQPELSIPRNDKEKTGLPASLVKDARVALALTSHEGEMGGTIFYQPRV